MKRVVLTLIFLTFSVVTNAQMPLYQSPQPYHGYEPPQNQNQNQNQSPYQNQLEKNQLGMQRSNQQSQQWQCVTACSSRSDANLCRQRCSN